jgi:hypothetical protein
VKISQLKLRSEKFDDDDDDDDNLRPGLHLLMQKAVKLNTRRRVRKFLAGKQDRHCACDVTL